MNKESNIITNISFIVYFLKLFQKHVGFKTVENSLECISLVCVTLCTFRCMLFRNQLLNSVSGISEKSPDCAVGIYCHQFSELFYFSEIAICGHTLSVIMKNLIKIVSLSFVSTPKKERYRKRKKMILSILQFMCNSTRRRVKFIQICPF